MSLILDYSAYDYDFFTDDLPAISNINYLESGGSIVDEIMVRTKTDQGNTNVRDFWSADTRILANFVNSLEAGNISNSGVKIVSFKVKRRLATEANSIDIGTVAITTAINYDYYDYTQQNGNLVYTLVPVGENGLEGAPIDVNVLSSFDSIWLVDKDTNNVLAFDKAFNIGTADSTLNTNRTVIETFSKFAQVIYGQSQYESFTLSTVVLPDDGQQSYAKYMDILNKFVSRHTPKILKFDNGKTLVVDIGNIKTSTPTTTWQDYDYFTLSVDVTEIDDYENYMKGL